MERVLRMVEKTEGLGTMPTKDPKMVEYGRLGGKRSAEVRRRNAKIRNIVQKVMKSKFQPTDSFKAILEGMGIDTNEKTDVMTGIVAIFSHKAINGDLNAARFVIDIGGLNLESEERLARIEALDTMTDQNMEGMDGGDGKEPPNLEEIDKQARALGIYGD